MPTNPIPPNPLPCGCKAVGDQPLHGPVGSTFYRNIHVVMCPLHSAAEDLLKALDAFMDMWGSGDAGSSSKRAQQKRAEMWDLANAAVAKARPAKVERAGTERGA